MEVDGTSIPFQKLTNKEQVQYHKKGWCFRCCQQGHMASHCLKNTNYSDSSNIWEMTTTNTTNTLTTSIPTVVTNTTTPTPPPNIAPKLTCAQHIQAIEEEMDKEEQGAYLNAHDMGEDFCNARL